MRFERGARVRLVAHKDCGDRLTRFNGATGTISDPMEYVEGRDPRLPPAIVVVQWDIPQDRGSVRGPFTHDWVSVEYLQLVDEANCQHCGRVILHTDEDGWIDPEATGDDAIWREVCDSHDTFVAEHEPTPVRVASDA